MWRPSARRATTGAPAAAPSLSRHTVAATTVAVSGASTPAATSTAERVDGGLGGPGVSPWNPPGGGVDAVEAEGVLGDEPAEPGGQAQPRARAVAAAQRRSHRVAMPWVV